MAEDPDFRVGDVNQGILPDSDRLNDESMNTIDFGVIDDFELQEEEEDAEAYAQDRSYTTSVFIESDRESILHSSSSTSSGANSHGHQCGSSLPSAGYSMNVIDPYHDDQNVNFSVNQSCLSAESDNHSPHTNSHECRHNNSHECRHGHGCSVKQESCMSEQECNHHHNSKCECLHKDESSEGEKFSFPVYGRHWSRS